MNTAERSANLIQRCNARQGTLKVGKQYKPAIRAVRGEAPSLSQATRLWFHRHGRWLHALSQTEVAAALVAMFLPWVVDILEQLVLWPGPAANPLTAYDTSAACRYPASNGVVKIADRLGLLKELSTVSLRVYGELQWLPVPLVGDLLIVLQRPGLARTAANWTVKLSQAGFEERLGRRPLRRRSDAAVRKALARQKIEEVHFSEFGIPTIRIDGNTFDQTFLANLRLCFGFYGRPSTLDPLRRTELEAEFRALIGTGTPALAILQKLQTGYRCSLSDCIQAFHEAIWTRHLDVDLFRPVLIDQPLEHELQSPIDRYAHLLVAEV